VQLAGEKADHGYASSPKTLKDVEELASAKIPNLVLNGDLHNGLTGWTFGSSTNAVVDGVLVNTGNGNSSEAVAFATIGAKVVGNKYYARANVKVRSALCTRVRLYSVDTFQSISNPIMDNPYVMSGIITASTNSSVFGIYHLYPTATEQGGKSIEIDNVICINLTAAFGAGNEPTKEEMDAFIDSIGYFEGNTPNPNDIIRWQIENAQPVDISLKADHGYGAGDTVKTLKQVDDEISQLAGDVKKSIFQTIVDLTAGVETTIAHTTFTPMLNLKPVNIQVFHDGELKDVTVKYFTNGENYDIKLTSAVDLIGAEVAVVGTQLRSLKPAVGDICVWNANTQRKDFIAPENYNGATLPSGVTPIGVVFHCENGKAYIVSKDEQAQVVPWAAPFKSKMSGFDFTTGGSFTITVNAATTSVINYTSADTLATVAAAINAAINAGAANTALKNWTVTADLVNNCIALMRSWYTPNITIFTVVDLASKVTGSIICPDNQAKNSGLIPPYPLLVRNDGGTSVRAGLNFEKFHSYLYITGEATTNNVVGEGEVVRYSVFNETDNPALVAYYGTGEEGYAKYINDKMIKYPFPLDVLIHKDGKPNTDILSAVTYSDIDGTTKPVFPPAYICKNYATDGIPEGNWWLPSVYETYFLINGRKSDASDKVNIALAKIGGTLLNNALIGYWTCNENTTTGAYHNYGSSGRYTPLNKYISQNGTIPLHVRAITAV
ncbi:MAG: hypothetical protein VB079_06560, partial [Petrimonas sp.]|nr:hypothetical protein [Petrimonas sp.]